jgi:hypothetical protein
MSYFTLNASRSVCAVPNMVVSCSSQIPCFPDMLLRYFLNDVKIVSVAHVITGIIFLPSTFAVRGLG